MALPRPGGKMSWVVPLQSVVLGEAYLRRAIRAGFSPDLVSACAHVWLLQRIGPQLFPLIVQLVMGGWGLLPKSPSTDQHSAGMVRLVDGTLSRGYFQIGAPTHPQASSDCPSEGSGISLPLHQLTPPAWPLLFGGLSHGCGKGRQLIRQECWVETGPENAQCSRGGSENSWSHFNYNTHSPLLRRKVVCKGDN